MRSAVAAERLEQELAHQLDLVAEGLFDGPAFRLPSGELARRLVVKPLLVYYRREPEVLRVVFVRDARQRPLDR